MELGALQGLPCPACGVAGAIVTYRLRPNGTESAICSNGCDTAKLTAAAIRLNGSVPMIANGHAVEPSHDEQIFRWKAKVFAAGETLLLKDSDLRNLSGQNLRDKIADSFHALIKSVRDYEPPEFLTALDADEELQQIARDLVDTEAEKRGTVRRASSLIVEDQAQATIANAEYLARPEVIERLGYSQSIALMIGGKHHGKTTNVRTLALSVVRGQQIWGRATTQGAVIYAASDDEVASTRAQLLEMGWNSRSEPLHFVRIDPQSDATPDQVLEDIADLAISNQAVLIILDMLFDFVGIRDELSYAGTRQAIGQVQKLADNTKALVVGSHHTPKYLTDAHSAANAALGSQGISARFSPIILTRKWTEGLFTVESTTTRDPRGEALAPMRIRKNERGWIETTGEFKDWMKWEIWADRVMAFFDGGDKNAGHSVFEIAEKLELDRARVQNVCYQLTKLTPAKLIREKNKRGYRYYLASADMFEREGGVFNSSGGNKE